MKIQCPTCGATIETHGRCWACPNCGEEACGLAGVEVVGSNEEDHDRSGARRE